MSRDLAPTLVFVLGLTAASVAGAAEPSQNQAAPPVPKSATAAAVAPTVAKPTTGSAAEGTPSTAVPPQGGEQRQAAPQSTAPSPDAAAPAVVPPEGTTNRAEGPVAQPGPPPGSPPAPYQGAAPAPLPTQLPAEAATEPVPEPPKTYVHRFSLYVDYLGQWLTDTSYDLFSDRDVASRFGVMADADLLELASGYELSVEAGWAREMAEGSVLFSRTDAGASVPSNLSTTLSINHYHAGLRLRRVVAPWFMPHVRLWGGVSDIDVDLDAGQDGTYDSSAWRPFAAVGAGGSLSMLPRQRFALGVIAEGGFILQSSMRLEMNPSLQPEDIVTSGASLGKLKRSGPYARVGLFVRF